MIFSVSLTILIELFMPLMIGAFFALPEKRDMSETGLLLTLARAFVCGQILLFALFQPVSVFAVLKGLEMPFITKAFFGVTVLVTLLFWIWIIAKKRDGLKSAVKKGFDKPTVFGILAFLVLLFMIVMSFVMTYTDGDDAFYVTIAADAASSDSLYAKNPYTGFATTLLFRYIFAPFPLWLSLIARITGLGTAALAHSLFPWSMILLSFAVLYILADKVTEGDKKKRGTFMFFASLLVLFGDYSIYSTSNFLLARSRQGKAALATFVIPFILTVLYSSLKEMEEEKKVSLKNLFFIFASGFAAALCSTMGGALIVAITSLFALVILITYKKLKYPVLMVLLSLPSLAFAALYILMR